MKINIGFIINKLFKFFHKVALYNCKVDKTAKFGSGSYCVDTDVGRYSYMGNNCVVVNTKIGSFCSIASYCCIGGGAHPVDYFSTSPVFYKGRNIFRKNFSYITFNAEKPVIIGNDVWIGEKVFIKDGITVGNGAIIGAMSIITHDVPPYAIVGGVPAKIIRFRFNENEIKKIEASEWWKMNEEQLITFASNYKNQI